MSVIPEDQFDVKEKVKCPCGAVVMIKNLRAHEKTAKHLNGGVVKRKEVYAPKTDPALAVSQDSFGRDKFVSIPKPKQEVMESDEEEGEDDYNDEFEQLVEDDLKTLSDKLDLVIETLNAGFSALLGSEMDTIPEGEESDQKPDESKNETK